MTAYQFALLAHGGAGSDNANSDGTDRACERGLELMQSGSSALDAACAAVEVLENDGRFNAGVGSRRRDDGSIQMDAACMDGARHKFGAVAVVEGFQNPVHIAHALLGEPYHLLAGDGAARYAAERGFTALDENRVRGTGAKSSDTVGAVAWDGKQFAAALSTGGTGKSWRGRVGDVPLIGCGLYAGSSGAVAATGHGESIALNMTAYRAYQLLEAGASADAVMQEALRWFEAAQDIGILVVGAKDWAGGSNRSMAWSGRQGRQQTG